MVRRKQRRAALGLALVGRCFEARGQQQQAAAAGDRKVCGTDWILERLLSSDRSKAVRIEESTHAVTLESEQPTVQLALCPKVTPAVRQCK